MQMRAFVKSLPSMAKGLLSWFVLDALCNFSVSKCRFTCREQRSARVIITIAKEATDQKHKEFLTSKKRPGVLPCVRDCTSGFFSEGSVKSDRDGSGLLKGPENL